MSPSKRRALHHQSITSAAVEESSENAAKPASPTKQEVLARESQEQDNEAGPSEESDANAEERLRKEQLQKEKDALRAPFSELTNTNKNKTADEAATSAKVEPSKKASRITDVNKVIFVDSYILNYSTFLPGKLLGSTLNVGNLTNSEQIVELSIDSGSFQFNKKQINEKFGQPELPFVLDGPDSKGK